MRRATALLSAIILLGACSTERISTESASELKPRIPLAAATTGAATADEQRDLASLRRATASFHDFETAKNAGWSVRITGCMEDPPAGGMGFHFGNPTLIDGSANAEEPELLLFAPEENGRMRLVAVEYIVPLSEWKSASPPRLFGRDFKVNEAFEIWALHVWVWESNPSGVYKSWNPRVSCEHTDDVSAMSHL